MPCHHHGTGKQTHDTLVQLHEKGELNATARLPPGWDLVTTRMGAPVGQRFNNGPAVNHPLWVVFGEQHCCMGTAIFYRCENWSLTSACSGIYHAK